MFGGPPQKALEGKQSRDEDREALNALFASVITFAVFVGVIRTGKKYIFMGNSRIWTTLTNLDLNAIFGGPKL